LLVSFYFPPPHVSVVKRQKASNFWRGFQVNKFNFWGEGGGERGVRGGVEKKEGEELKEQIDMKVSTKFQINPSTNGWEKCIQSDMGMDHPTIHRTDKVFYRGACWRLKNSSRGNKSTTAIYLWVQTI
jgi:hypothetical protein